MSNGSTHSELGQSPETPTRVYKFHKPVKNTYGRNRLSTDPPSSPDPWSTSSLATMPTRSSSSNDSSSPSRHSRLSGSFQDISQVPWTPTTKGTRALTDKLASTKLEFEDGGSSSSNEDQENTDNTIPGLHIGLDSPMKRKRELVAEEATPTIRQSPRRRPQQQAVLDSDNDDEEGARSQHSTRSSSTPPSSPSQRSKRTKVVLPLTPSSSSSSNGSSAATEKKAQQATLSSFFTTSASKGTGILKGRIIPKQGTIPPKNDTKKPAEPAKKLEQLFLAFSKDRTKSSASGSPRTRTGGLSRESERSKRYHCPQCGMPYVRGQPDDEQIHDRYHRVAVGGIDYPGYKNEVIVAWFSDQDLEQSVIPASSYSSSTQHQSSSTGSLGESRIVVVSMTDGGSIFEKKKVREVLEMVNKELGSVEFDPETLEGCKVFLYISGKKKVVGCVVAERIKQGFEIVNASSSSNTAAGENSILVAESSSRSDPADMVVKDRSPRVIHHSSAIFCSTVPQPAICGINRIWVSTLYRRHKIASRLLDAVRDRFIYACKLEQKDLAFSQPTGDGKALARQYLGTDKFLVYVE